VAASLGSKRLDAVAKGIPAPKGVPPPQPGGSVGYGVPAAAAAAAAGGRGVAVAQRSGAAVAVRGVVRCAWSSGPAGSSSRRQQPPQPWRAND